MEKLYINKITGKVRPFSDKFFKKLPSRIHDGKTYPNNGFVPYKQEEVETPESAKPRTLSAKDIDVIKQRVLGGNLKGLTIDICRQYAEHESIEAPKDLDLRGWLKLVSDHVKSQQPAEQETNKEQADKKTTRSAPQKK